MDAPAAFIGRCKNDTEANLVVIMGVDGVGRDNFIMFVTTFASHAKHCSVADAQGEVTAQSVFEGLRTFVNEMYLPYFKTPGALVIARFPDELRGASFVTGRISFLSDAQTYTYDVALEHSGTHACTLKDLMVDVGAPAARASQSYPFKSP